MIYIENNLEKQDVFIPRNDGSTCYVSPYDKGYQDGYQDGIEDCGDCPIQQKEVILTATTETISPDQGYAGMDSVFVDARQLALEKYNEGYHEGEEDGAEEQKSKLETVTFDRNGEYTREDGWSAVTVDVPKDINLGTLVDAPPRISDLTYDTYINTFDPQEASVDGWGKVQIDLGFIIGDAKNQQKALMTGTTFTQNGLYRREDGWNEVIVEVPQTGTSCNLESKTETVTADTQTILPSSGYDGMSEVVVDATDYGQDKYDEGFADGQASVPPCPSCPEIESGVTYGIGSGFTGATVTPSSGYDGMAEVTITDNGYGQEKYDEGHDDGYNEGFTDGQTDILSGMTTTAFTQNDTYTNASGWSAVTVNVPQTGSSCNLETSTYTLQSGFTGDTIYPSSGYDGMSAVTITDGGYGREKYDEGYADGALSPCPLQDKSVVLTATTECIYPDSGNYRYYLGTANAVWNKNNLVDTGVYPTQTSIARLKYVGRGVRSDRIVGSIDGYQGCNDNSDYRVFDLINLTLDVGNARRTIYSISSITQNSVVYDITYGNAYIYDNINETYLLQNGTQTVNTGYTYTVDFGSIWIKEFIIEDGGVELYHGVPREVNGVAGLYDTVSNTFNAAYSGATNTPIVQAVSIDGYQGLSSVCVDASNLCQEKYNEGYQDGLNDCPACPQPSLEQKSVTLTAATETITPSQGYDGMDEVSIDASGLCQTYYNSGYTEGAASVVGTQITIAPDVWLSQYGTYYFTYDSATSISAMTVHFRLGGNVITYVSSRNQVEITGHYRDDGTLWDERAPKCYDSYDNLLTLVSNTYENGVGKLVFNDNIDRVGDLWYNNQHIVSVTFPEGMRQFKMSVVQYCGLTGLTIPSTVEAIEYEAFLGNNITEVTFPDGCYHIAYESFMYNPVSSITFGSGTTYIGDRAFEPCGIPVCSRPAWDNTRDSLKRIYAYMPTPSSDIFGQPDPADPTTPPNPFHLRTGSGILYVPQGSSSYYQNWLTKLPSGWTISDTL